MNSINGQDQLADDLYGNWSGGIHAVASHSNYIGKLLESIVRDSLLTHFNTHDLLSNNQHGFIPGRSCVTQLLFVLDDWTRAMMEGHNTDVVYFDFSMAFDTVPHKRLIHKLRAYGIGGKLLEWLQSFLSDREQSVVINSVFSSCMETCY